MTDHYVEFSSSSFNFIYILIVMYIFSQSFSDDVCDTIPFLYYTFNNIHKYHASLSDYRTCSMMNRNWKKKEMLHIMWNFVDEEFNLFKWRLFFLQFCLKSRTYCRRWKWWCWGSRRHNEMIQCSGRRVVDVTGNWLGFAYRQDATQAGVYIIFNDVK